MSAASLLCDIWCIIFSRGPMIDPCGIHVLMLVSRAFKGNKYLCMYLTHSNMLSCFPHEGI